VYWQGTHEKFRGNGVCGALIIAANEYYKKEFGTPIRSSTHFIQEYKKQSMRVWRKLVKAGKAYEYKFHGKTRFGML
jgi:hypothetical protein